MNNQKGKKWTLERLKISTREIYGDKYDISLVKEIKNGHDSPLVVLCNTCNEYWNCKVEGFINAKRGCPNCDRNIRCWTLDIFIKRAKKIYGNKHDYSLIKSVNIKNQKSKIPIKCNDCEYIFHPSIGHYINQLSSCSRCNNMEKWTYERLIKELKILDNKDIDYSLIKIEDVKNGTSKIPLKCNKCGFNWNAIVSKIARGGGCWHCNIGKPATYERLIKETILEKEIDYSLISPEDIKNTGSYLKLKCRICDRIWYSTFANHIYHKKRCPKCQSSKGEKESTRILIRLGIKFKTQVYFEENKRLKYDICFMMAEDGYILEWDGEQHFEIIQFFHMDKEKLVQYNERDIFKTKTAIENGYNMIRIDYTQFKNIQYHIKKALELKQELYLSTPEMYNWLTENL